MFSELELALEVKSTTITSRLADQTTSRIVVSAGSAFPQPDKNDKFLRFFIIIMGIRECGSTLYVGLARVVPPTNTNFRFTFLLTRIQEALYEDIPV